MKKYRYRLPLLSLCFLLPFSTLEGQASDKDWFDLNDLKICSQKNTELRQTANQFGSIMNHGDIQPQFIEEVFKSNQDILEVGPGDGPALKQILMDDRNLETAVNYTVVEPSLQHLKIIDQTIKEQSKNPKNWFGKAKNGDIRQFIEGKENKYDLIFCSQVLHFLNPQEQLNVLQGLHKALKNKGKLFIITNSIYAIDNWYFSQDTKEYRPFVEYFHNSQQKEDLWPGYLSEHLSFTAQRIFLKSRDNLPYDLPTLHTSNTLEHLLRAIGFKIELCRHFTETSSEQKEQKNILVNSIRVGAIVSKDDKIKPNKKMLEMYQKQAQSKLEHRNWLENFMKKEETLLNYITSLLKK